MAEGTAGIAHTSDPLVSAVLELLHAAVMVQTEQISSVIQNPKSHPKSVRLQKSPGENLLAFAPAVLCQLMAGKQVYVGIFRGGFQVAWSAKGKDVSFILS